MCYNNDLKRFYIYRISFGITFGILAVVGLLCMTAGYVANKKFNRELKEAICKITAHDIIKRRCSYTCHCHTIIINEQSHIRCRTCYRDCYYGYIIIEITNVINNFYKYIINYNQQGRVELYLNQYFPINSVRQCFYTKNEKPYIVFNKKNEEGPFIAGVCFLIVAGVVLFLWGVLELTYFFYPAKKQILFCQDCNHQKAKSKQNPLCTQCTRKRNAIKIFLENNGHQNRNFENNFINNVIRMNNVSNEEWNNELDSDVSNEDWNNESN